MNSSFDLKAREPIMINAKSTFFSSLKFAMSASTVSILSPSSSALRDRYLSI
jgi:hypothetical protein